MHYPWANTVLLALLVAQLVSGVSALLAGAERWQWVLWSHIVGAYAVGVVLCWKGAVIVGAIRRRPAVTTARSAFLILSLLLLLTLTAGFLWSYSGPYSVGGFTLLTVHGFLGLASILLLVWHVLAKRFIFRVPRARDRRAFLRFGAFSLAGLLLWRMDRPAQTVLGLSGAARRFTGSYETGSFSGSFPHVIWLFDKPPRVIAETWRLRIDGAVEHPRFLSLADLTALPGLTQNALIDCTGGWYSTQEWQGVPLSALLVQAGIRAAARSVTVMSVTGYSRRFALDELDNYLLATHVGGQQLDQGHGFPLRLVAPGRRGFEWVKWVSHLRVNTLSAYLQSPFPLQ